MGTDFVAGHAATGTRDDGFKKAGRFRLGTRKKFFPVWVVRHQLKLPRGMVDAHLWKHSRSGSVLGL